MVYLEEHICNKYSK